MPETELFAANEVTKSGEQFTGGWVLSPNHSARKHHEYFYESGVNYDDELHDDKRSSTGSGKCRTRP